MYQLSAFPSTDPTDRRNDGDMLSIYNNCLWKHGSGTDRHTRWGITTLRKGVAGLNIGQDPVVLSVTTNVPYIVWRSRRGTCIKSKIVLLLALKLTRIRTHDDHESVHLISLDVRQLNTSKQKKVRFLGEKKRSRNYLIKKQPGQYGPHCKFPDLV